MTEHAAPLPFAAPGTPAEVEGGAVFMPRFDKDGLIAAIVTDSATGNVLMFAWMNADALARTLATGEAHFWSRSRKKLWRKGEESGNTLAVDEVRTDCDQDALWIRVRVAGDGVACHTGAPSCFYRQVVPGGPEGTGPALARAPLPAITAITAILQGSKK